jgi:hypothetical protein
MRKEVYSHVLSRYKPGGENFPSQIAIGDDIWTYKYEPHEMTVIRMALPNFFLEEQI